MNISHAVGAAAVVAALALASPAFAQPETKLTRNLSAATVKAVWCSSLFLEESYQWDDGSEEAIRYEDMAYDLGDALDEVMAEAGLPPAESEEIWAIFDEAAVDFASDDNDAFLVELEACEQAYRANKLKLF
jgi:hypothetical protein